MTDLKPCPFCGSDNIAHRTWWNSLHETGHFIECYDCGCKTGFLVDDSAFVAAVHDTEAEAIEAWNTRHERTCEVTDIDTGNEAAYEHYEHIMHCKSCHHEYGYVQYNEDGDTWMDELPNFCPNCGAKVVD